MTYNTIEDNRYLLTIANRNFKKRHSFIVSLTNGSTQFDVAFCPLIKLNHNASLYQNGLLTQKNPIMIAINGRAAFCIDLEDDKTEWHLSYLMEKLYIDEGEKGIAEQIFEILEMFKYLRY